MTTKGLWALVPLTLTACAGTVTEPPPGLAPEQAYQAIANALPGASFGFPDHPGLVEMAERDLPPPPSRNELSASEVRFQVILDVYWPRVVEVPYAAIEEVRYRYALFPNLLFCVALPFIQVSEMQLVLREEAMPELRGWIEEELVALERLSSRIGLGGPYYHAMSVRAALEDAEEELGPGRLPLTFRFVSPVPPWFPYTAPARELGEAFVRARQAAE